MKILRLYSLAGAALCFLLPHSIYAQAITAKVVGTVSDRLRRRGSDSHRHHSQRANEPDPDDQDQ